jgi:hypothetical protein
MPEVWPPKKIGMIIIVITSTAYGDSLEVWWVME